MAESYKHFAALLGVSANYKPTPPPTLQRSLRARMRRAVDAWDYGLDVAQDWFGRIIPTVLMLFLIVCVVNIGIALLS